MVNFPQKMIDPQKVWHQKLWYRMSCLGVLVKNRRHPVRWLLLPEKERQEVYPSLISFLLFAHELVSHPALDV